MKGGFRLKRLDPRGFTMTEVLIVLAVTGALFVSAALMIAGKQRQAEFNVAIREVQTQIQQTLNEVSTGYYPSLSNFQCNAGAGPVFSAGAAEQGTNSACIFLGRVIHFGVPGTGPQKFMTYTVAGLRVSGSNEVTTLAQARPTVVPMSFNSSVEERVLRGGLQVVPCTANPACGGVQQRGAVGFISSLATYGAGGTINSGAQRVDLMPVTNTNYGVAEAIMIGDINTRLATSPANPANGVAICFASGTTNQSGLITIGGGGRQLSVKLDIKGNTTCAP